MVSADTAVAYTKAPFLFLGELSSLSQLTLYVTHRLGINDGQGGPVFIMKYIPFDLGIPPRNKFSPISGIFLEYLTKSE